MFGRKKKKEKKHKPGMTTAELDKLEEVAVRRGFFNVKKTSKQELNVKKEEPTPVATAAHGRPIAHGRSDLHPSGAPASGEDRNGKAETEDNRSVLEKAAMYGDLAKGQAKPHQAPFPVPSRRLRPATDVPATEKPKPPSRKKSSKSKSTDRDQLPPMKLPPLGSSAEYSQPLGSTGSHPNLPSSRSPPPAKEQGYSVPTPWVTSPVSKSSNGIHYDYPNSPPKVSSMFSPLKSTKTVMLRKRKSGDFGISLRRSSMIEHSASGSTKKTIYFAEPGSAMQAAGESIPLSQGDRLIAINDRNVEDASRDDIISLIRSAKDQISITVQSIPELAEPPSRPMKPGDHAGEKREERKDRSREEVAKDFLKQTVEETIPAPKKAAVVKQAPAPVFDESQWETSGKVWYLQKDGFLSALTLKYVGDGDCPVEDGKMRIKLESGEIVTVDEDSVEKVNPEEYDRSENISSLRFLNECGVLNVLQQRYKGGLAYTYAGPHLLSLRLDKNQSHSGSDPNAESFKGCRYGDMPPHILSAAQEAYAQMTTTGSDQSILMTGYSGSGKTANLQAILKYLASVSDNNNLHISGEKFLAVSTILDSFSSAKTAWCRCASRCAFLYTLGFDRSGVMGSVAVQCMLFESHRAVRRPKNEGNFEIFYQLVDGADSQLSRELLITKEEQAENVYLFDENFKPVDSEMHREEMEASFKKLKSAMDLLGFTADEIKSCFGLLAACMHLQVAGSQKVNSGRYQFLKPDAAQKAGSLLGFSIENLARAIFQPSSSSHQVGSPTTPRSAKALQRSLSNASMQGDIPEGTYSGQDNLEGFIIGLYNEVFRLVMSVVNRALSSPSFNAKASILVVDTPGVQHAVPFAGTDGALHTFASMEDLFFNYAQERLQLLFHHNAFTRLYDRYQQEDITCDFEPFEDDANAVVDAMDRPPAQGRVGGSNLLTDAKGLFWLLDEEAIILGASEESFIERLNMFFGNPTKDSLRVIQKGHRRNHFFIHHFMGSCPVEYDATDWLKLCREHPIIKTVADVLQDSKKTYISTIIGGRTATGNFSGSVVGLDNVGRSLTIRRHPSLRKVFTTTMTSANATAATKKKSLPMMKKLQVNSLIDALQRTQIHFVFCLNPCKSSNKDHLDVKLLKNQVKGFQLLPATRIYKQGYPEHMVFSEFRRCYEVLCKQIGSESGQQNVASTSQLDNKEASELILKACDLERSQYRLGISQVLFRAGVLAQLEKSRNEKISTILTKIQAQGRGYLARKYCEKRKVQVVAIRCIQRNFRKFLVVRQWPWWRLLTKVLPLVEVHRTEEDLREREAELELLQSKYDKIVAERDELKQDNENFESQLNDVIGELTEERQTASHASEMLEQEMRERMKLEKEVEDMQASNRHFRQICESMEVELAEQRLLRSNERNSMLDSSDEDGDISEYKMKMERLKREAEFKHKKEIQDFEEKLEQAEANKKQADKRYHLLQEEYDDQERIASQNKKKAHRTLAELNDTKVHLEETNAKLHELEKKQRKFDSEMYAVQAELTEMKMTKDRLQREKDELSVDVYTKKNELEESTGDMEALQRKIERLEQELEETAAKDSEEGQLLNSLKKQRRDLEAKIKDQEEELDEQAGQIQMLQQAKERLEMTSERTRQQHSRELDSKEEELEEMRVSYQKKIKHLEAQLEEEEEERSSAMKQRRDLEQQLAELRDNQPQARRDADAERRLRKDLKRYKALLDDAQTMIDHLKTDAVNKQQLKQIRIQLEESEYSCANAVKAKKAIELELDDVQSQLEEISKAKQDAETRVSLLQRENHQLNSRLEEDADDSQELTKKFKNLLSRQSDDRKEIVDLSSQIDDHKREKEMLNEKILTMQSQLEYLQENTTDKSNVTRLEAKTRDLETRLDFEKTSTRRLEVQLGRLKENVEKLQSEKDSQAASEHREKEQCKRLQKQLRDAKDEQADILKREREALQRQRELESEVLEYVSQTETLQSDLNLAFKRISDLQIAFEELEDSDLALSGSDDFDSDSDDGATASSLRRSNYSRYSHGTSSTRPSNRLSVTSEEDSASFRFRRHSKSSDVNSKDSDDDYKSYRREKYKYDSSDDESDV